MHADAGFPDAARDLAGGEPGGHQVLLEREKELAVLRAAGDAARARAGAVVVIHGPPGAGKSALLSAAESEARRSGITVLAGRGRELERTVALGVATELLAPPLLAAPIAQRARLLTGLAAPRPPCSPGPRRRIWPLPAPRFAACAGSRRTWPAGTWAPPGPGRC